MQAAKRTPVDLQAWAVGLMERDNRKSHLAPQLSPTTQDLLRSTDSPTDRYNTTIPNSSSTNNNGVGNPLETPTSGDIPIGRSGLPTPRDQYDYARTPSAAVHPPPPSSAGAGQTFNLPVRSAPVPARNGTPEEGGRRQRYGVAPGYGYYPSN